MKILIVNKFLYPHGGSETYILDIGRELERTGHEVQYFGMDAKERMVGNRINSYTSPMDFHEKGLQKLLYPFKIIYSTEARKMIRLVLDDFQPDVVHLNNINFQLTPSIIMEIRKWEKQSNTKVKIVYTAHDSQWVCPNHMLMIPSSKERCFRCKGGKYIECTRNRCIHGSFIKSILGMMEGYLYRVLGTYKQVDTIICPSNFMKEILSSNSDISDRLVMIHNYCNIAVQEYEETKKEDYVLYFGRYSEEKGIGVLLEVCRNLPDIPFVFAGDGPLREEVEKVGNIKNLGFLTGKDLYEVIKKARFTVVPSVWYENCPFTVIESQVLGTPVIGSNLGGIPELIDVGKTGEVFEVGNVEELLETVLRLWNDIKKSTQYSKNCKKNLFDELEIYCNNMKTLYSIERRS